MENEWWAEAPAGANARAVNTAHAARSFLNMVFILFNQPRGFTFAP